MAAWLSQFFGQFGSGLVAFGTVYGFFSFLEGLVSEPTKAGTTAWLKRLDISQVTAHWPNHFARLFDRLFGTKHLSLHCFAASCYASLIFAALCLLIMMMTGAYWPPDDEIFKSRCTCVAFIFLFSLIPDYVCLLKTRYAIKLMQRTRSFPLILIIFFADIALVPLVWWIGSFIGWTFFALLFGYAIDAVLHRDIYAEMGFSPYAAAYVISTIQLLVILAGVLKSALSAFFFAEFFTTLWALLYFLAGSISRLMLRSQFVVTHLVRFFDVDTKPLQSIGFVAGCLAALLWWGVTFLPIGDIPFLELPIIAWGYVLQAMLNVIVD